MTESKANPPVHIDPPKKPKKPKKWQQFVQAVGEAIGNAKFDQ